MYFHAFWSFFACIFALLKKTLFAILNRAELRCLFYTDVKSMWNGPLFLFNPGTYAGGIWGCSAPSKKVSHKKSPEKDREKQTYTPKLRKLIQMTIMLFTNGSKVMCFGGGYPPHTIFFLAHTSPKSTLDTSLFQSQKHFYNYMRAKNL